MSRKGKWMSRGRVCALVVGITLSTARPASALTIGLDFVTGPTTDIFGVGTTTADYSGFGYTGMTTAQIQQSILDSVIMDYLGYPTMAADPLSPLAAGKALNINFVLSTSTLPPSNGDSEYYFLAIGNKTTSISSLGQACLACVRTATGGGAIIPVGSIVGSILVDNILGLAGLATTNAQRTNLLAGTVSHEAGHALSLDHSLSALANPGESGYDLLATGAAPTFMPNGERVMDRAFGYSQFGLLITAVGTADTSEVPEPAPMWLSGIGLLVLAARRR